jgi:hypothetical protein
MQVGTYMVFEYIFSKTQSSQERSDVFDRGIPVTNLKYSRDSLFRRTNPNNCSKMQTGTKIFKKKIFVISRYAREIPMIFDWADPSIY